MKTPDVQDMVHGADGFLISNHFWTMIGLDAIGGFDDDTGLFAAGNFDLIGDLDYFTGNEVIFGLN